MVVTQFTALLQFENLALSLVIIAGFCLLSGGTALVVGALIFGFDIAMSLASALQTASLAATEDELNEAADELAHVVLAVGVAAFIKGVGKIAKGRAAGGKGADAEAPKKPAAERAKPKQTPTRQPAQQRPPKTAAAPVMSIDEAIAAIGKLKGKSAKEIEAQLQATGYSSVTGKNGGTIWTKALPDGNTAAVRIDPPMVRTPPKGFADEQPHIHKEIVQTSKVTNGNYKPSDAIKLDDDGVATNDPSRTHIPSGQ